MRPFLTAIAIAASLGVANSASAQAVDHSAHHPADAAKVAPVKPASPAQMQCKGMMDGKMGAGKGAPAAGAPSKDGPATEQQKKHCAEMMAQMHGGHAKPAK